LKALVLEAKFKAVINENFPMPEIGDNEVLVKIKAVGVCGTDFKLYRGEYGDGYPLIPGHEFAGVIEKVGNKVPGITTGEKVTAVPPVPCGHCSYCIEGQHNHCINRMAIGVLNDGAFAEYVKVPVTNIVSINELSFAKATFVEPLACVIRAVERSKVKLGEKVLVLGTGTTGQLFAQVFRSMGCEVYMLGRNAIKLKVAEQEGVNILSSKEKSEADIIKVNIERIDILVDAIGQPQLTEKFMPVLRKGGRLVVFGVSQGTLHLNYFDIYRKELQIIGSFAQQEKFSQAIMLLKNNVVNVDALISHQGSLEDVKELFDKGKPADLIKFIAFI